MRFRRLHARTFGPLRVRAFELDPGVVLVHGPNESGKSTFRSALDTILFGFEPARRDTHPLFLWDEEGGDLWLEAEVALDEGARLAVERVLQSAGRSRLAEPGEPFEGPREGNRALAAVEATPRDLFRSVYSLAVDDLAALDAGVQSQVDHLLLPAQVCDGLRPTSRVLAELRKEHQALWRPDKRGKTEAQRLQTALYEARRELRRAAEEEDELRAAVDEREELAERARELRARREELEAAEREAPFLRRLFELDYRRRAAPTPVDLSALAGDPLVDPRKLSEEIHALESQLEGPRARLRREPLVLDERERELVARGGEIEAAARARPRRESQDAAALEGAERLERLEEARAAELRALGVRDGDALAPLTPEVLRARRDAWEHEREEAAARARAGPDPLSIALVLAGAAALALSGPGPAALLAPLGGACVLGGLWRGARVARAARAPLPGLDAETAGRLSRAGLDAAFHGTPSALQRVIDALERLARQDEEIRAVRARLDEARARAAETEASWLELARSFGVEAAPGERALAELEDLRRAALERAEAARADDAERARAKDAIAFAEPSLAALRGQRERLERALRANQPKCSDLTAAYEEVQRRIQEEDWLRRQRAELERDPLWERLADDPRARADVDPEEALWDPERARARREELARLDEERSRVDRRSGEIDRMVEDDPGARQARVQERIQALEAELESVHRGRDRLALLERVLEDADRLFRDAHQPDVLRRAGRYLALVTGGRYTRLDADPDARSGLRVFGEERAAAVPVGPPLSRGTRDQIHLCLRLGLLDHLDEGREKLPLVLDEVLVHWDEERRGAIYPLLREVSASRQVFLLTCHEWIAEETVRALGIAAHRLGEAAAGAST